MIKNNLLYSLFISLLTITVNSQNKDLFIPRMTAINPVSLTDVIFVGEKDTVLIAACNGKISKVIKGNTEKVISRIADEVYVLSYNPNHKHIAASTLENGILIINEGSGKIIKRLPLIQTWSLRLDYSDDFKLLYANDQRGNKFLWDVINDYKPIQLAKSMPLGAIISVKSNVITIVTPQKMIRWDYINSKTIDEIAIKATRITDVDNSSNFLNLNFNECELFDVTEGKVLFTLKHPSWLRSVESIGGEDAARTAGLTIQDGYFNDTNYQMALTAAKFSKNKIFTSGIDRSIRVWDKKTGQLIQSLTGHNATISKIKVSPNENQLVSIDLKGGIKFWDIN